MRVCYTLILSWWTQKISGKARPKIHIFPVSGNNVNCYKIINSPFALNSYSFFPFLSDSSYSAFSYTSLSEIRIFEDTVMNIIGIFLHGLTSKLKAYRFFRIWRQNWKNSYSGKTKKHDLKKNDSNQRIMEVTNRHLEKTFWKIMVNLYLR